MSGEIAPYVIQAGPARSTIPADVLRVEGGRSVLEDAHEIKAAILGKFGLCCSREDFEAVAASMVVADDRPKKPYEPIVGHSMFAVGRIERVVKSAGRDVGKVERSFGLVGYN